MSSLSEQAVYNALAGVVDRAQLSGLRLQGGEVGFVLSIGADDDREASQKSCEDAVLALEGVTAVTVLVTAHRESPAEAAPATTRKSETRKAAQWNHTKLPHVKRVIAVASGKGGVGKSTTTVMLAHALTAMGQRVGILDADIFGPSIPRMLGLEHAGQPTFTEGLIQPHAAHGLRAMSMGFITGEQAAMMRGAMVTKVLAQMLRQVAWGNADAPLDVLLVDMPPGTGDIHISMVQQVPLDGAVMVTTPQEIAVIDARKCVQLFQRANVPLLGVIENMSGFTDPSGQTHRLFGEGGGQKLAAEAKAAFLGEVPLLPVIGTAMEAGQKPDNLPEPYCHAAQILIAV